MAKQKQSKRDRIAPLLSLIKDNEQARDTVRSMLDFSRIEKKDTWRGLIATPPGSILEKTIDSFRDNTDIPLEIPFFVSLHFISAWLLKQNVKLNFSGAVLEPDIWSVILAPSGAGKSFTSNLVKKSVETVTDNDLDLFPNTASSAKFVEELSKHNRTLWMRDEFAQFLKSLDHQGHMEEIKEYLLKIYDNDKISRSTKKYNIEIEDPALTILGMTVYHTFFDNISMESMLDGFAQRFSYIIARKDPDRKIEDFPLYPVDKIKNSIKSGWSDLLDIDIHNEYYVDKKGVEGFKRSFGMLVSVKEKIDESFFRRIMWRGVKYALIYHIILGKESNLIDEKDMGWAGRVSWLHMQDAKEILDLKGCSDLEKIIRRAEEVRDKIKKDENREVTPRDIVLNVYNIKNVNEAKSIMSML